MTKNKVELIKEIVTLSLAFLMPFIALIILFSANQIALFSYSNKTIISLDMQSQYICYLRDFRNTLLNGGSLVYSTEKVFGGDYLSIYTFYLSSPFNYLVVFFKEEALPLFFAWTSILKMSLAGLFFYLLLRFDNNKFDYYKLIFAFGYSFISYSFVYMSNFMWLDGVMILPLVILGVRFLEEKKHYWLYPIALAYAVITSWYIGFMIGMFVGLFFIYRFFVSFNKENKEFLKFLIRFIIFTIVGILIASICWITALFHLSGTKANVDLPPSEFFNLSMVLSGFMENSYSSMNQISRNQDFITMFVGVVPLVFFVIFFFDKRFSLKERLILLGFFLFYFICSLSRVMTALLHGGKEPTWFPGRYSFVIGFLVCYIASKSFEDAHKFNPFMYAIPLVVGVIAVIIVLTTKNSEAIDTYPLSGASLILYLATIFIGFSVSFFNQRIADKEPTSFISKVIPYALLSLIIVEVASSYRGGDQAFYVNRYSLQSYSKYLEDDKYTSSFNKIKSYDQETYGSSFYRMEATFNRPGNYNLVDNNPMFYSYNGLSNFSSSSKKNVESYMRKIGFHYNYYFCKYDSGSTYAINSLLGVKYLLEDKYENENIHPYFLDSDTFEKLSIEDTNKVEYYYNPNALSVGFSADPTSSYFINEGNKSNTTDNVYWFDHFEYQNEIFKTIVGDINKDIFNPLELITFESTISYDTNEFGVKILKNIKRGDSIYMEYRLPVEGYDMPLYFGEKSNYEQAYFYVDNQRMMNNTYWHNGIVSFADTTSHVHRVRVSFNEDRDSFEFRPEMYYEDINVTKEYLNSLKSQEFVLEKVQNTFASKRFIGHIDVTNNNKDLIFTLPNQEGMKVYIDGKKQEVQTKLNVFTGVSLKDISTGTHKVEIRYQDTALIVAFPITIISLLGVVPLVMFYSKLEDKVFNRKKKEEQEKEPN